MHHAVLVCRWRYHEQQACLSLSECLHGPRSSEWQAADLAPACWQVKHTATVIDPGREKEKRAQERERTIRSKDALTRRQASMQLLQKLGPRTLNLGPSAVAVMVGTLTDATRPRHIWLISALDPSGSAPCSCAWP